MKKMIFARPAALAFLLVMSAPLFALPASDIRFEEMVIHDNEFKEALHLNDNQKTLWKKIETGMREIQRLKQRRKDDLQAAFKAGLSNTQPDLRALSTKLDEEAKLSAQDDKKLRELWLEMDDALDDNQRQISYQRLRDQLSRAEDRGPRDGFGGDEPRERGGRGGGHGSRGGGMPRF